MSNAEMNQPHDIEQRLTALEVKTSFADDMLDQLNQTIFRQQQQIDQLLREVAALSEQASDAGGGAARSPDDEVPPHY